MPPASIRTFAPATGSPAASLTVPRTVPPVRRRRSRIGRRAGRDAHAGDVAGRMAPGVRHHDVASRTRIAQGETAFALVGCSEWRRHPDRPAPAFDLSAHRRARHRLAFRIHHRADDRASALEHEDDVVAHRQRLVDRGEALGANRHVHLARFQPREHERAVLLGRAFDRRSGPRVMARRKAPGTPAPPLSRTEPRRARPDSSATSPRSADGGRPESRTSTSRAARPGAFASSVRSPGG